MLSPFVQHTTYRDSGRGLSGVTVRVLVTPADTRKLFDRFEKLGDDVRRKIIRDELRAWARETTKLVRARTPVKTGRLKKDIGSKFRTYRSGGIYWTAVGGRTYKSSKGREEFGKDYLGAGWRLHFVTGPVRRHRGKGVKQKGKRFPALRGRGQRSTRLNWLEEIARVTRARSLARLQAAMQRELSR